MKRCFLLKTLKNYPKKWKKNIEENEVIVEQPQTAEGDQSTSQANTTASK